MRVRRLRAGDDLGPAICLLQRFFLEEDFDTPEAIIAENTRQMIGIEFGWSVEMGDLYVCPEWRGKGVSRLLLLAAEDILRRRGAKGYQVTVTPFAEEHHDLKNFYTNLGFASEGRLILWKSLV